MARWHCPACDGEYDDTLGDGLAYFHSCPPLVKLRIRQKDGTIALVDGRMVTTAVDDGKGGKTFQQTFDPPLPAGATFLEERFVPRPGHRDENVVVDPNDRKVKPKSPGAARRLVPSTP